MSQNQAYLFYVFLLTGILIGLLFDIFRILRKSFKFSDLSTIFQDFIFCLITCIIVLYTVFKFNNGIVRSYVLFGICTGLILYLLLFSKIFVTANVKILIFIKRICNVFFKIIISPIKFVIKFIKRLTFKPISFIIINVKKMTKNTIKKRKKDRIKKDFKA